MSRFEIFFERVKGRIELAVKARDRSPIFSFETVLQMISVVYAGLMVLRARLYQEGVLPAKTLPCCVVSVGNLIVGGTGKTPMTILIARMFRDMGCRVVVISRGYRGRMENTGGVVSDGHTIFTGPEDAGDEPYLMARVLTGIPVVVGKRRYEAGMMAVMRFKPDVIVFDDAFQHLRLHRDLNLVLLDHRSPLGNGHVLPRGPLREPRTALHRAHAVIFTRSHQAEIPSVPIVLAGCRPVFHSMHVPVIRKTGQTEDDRYIAEAMGIDNLKGQKIVAFAGLADNEQFFDSLVQAGCNIRAKFSFADHHRYGSNDLDAIAAAAKAVAADLVVTTFKDYVKIENWDQWPVVLVAVDVTITIVDEDKLYKIISDCCKVAPKRNACRRKSDHHPDSRTHGQ